MNIESLVSLSSFDKQAVERLIARCHQEDGSYRSPYLDSNYNFNASMPAFFLAKSEKGDLLGYLSIYADEPKEAELQIFVDPNHRRQGIAKRLLQQFSAIAEQYQLIDISYVSEQVFLEQNPHFLKRLAIEEIDERELWLDYLGPELPFSKRADLAVRRADLDSIEAVAHIQSQAFENPYETSLHYAREALTATDHRLYVLELEDEIVASVTVNISSDSYFFFGLAVAQQHRRKGFASYLLSAVMNELTKQKPLLFQIVVEKSNIPALECYQKLGFSSKTEVVYLGKRSEI